MRYRTVQRQHFRIVRGEMNVRAYFHRMGHVVCETCNWQGAKPSSLVIHLEQHAARGHVVPNGQIDRLRASMEANWTQALLEGSRKC